MTQFHYCKPPQSRTLLFSYVVCSLLYSIVVFVLSTSEHQVTDSCPLMILWEFRFYWVVRFEGCVASNSPTRDDSLTMEAGGCATLSSLPAEQRSTGLFPTWLYLFSLFMSSGGPSSLFWLLLVIYSEDDLEALPPLSLHFAPPPQLLMYS